MLPLQSRVLEAQNALAQCIVADTTVSASNSTAQAVLHAANVLLDTNSQYLAAAIPKSTRYTWLLVPSPLEALEFDDGLGCQNSRDTSACKSLFTTSFTEGLQGAIHMYSFSLQRAAALLRPSANATVSVCACVMLRSAFLPAVCDYSTMVLFLQQARTLAIAWSALQEFSGLLRMQLNAAASMVSASVTSSSVSARGGHHITLMTVRVTHAQSLTLCHCWTYSQSLRYP